MARRVLVETAQAKAMKRKSPAMMVTGQMAIMKEERGCMRRVVWGRILWPGKNVAMRLEA